MTAFLLALWTKIRGWVLGAIAIAATFFTVYLAGRKGGRQEAELEESKNDVIEARKITEETQASARDRADVESDIASRPPGSSLGRLRDRWARNRPDR